MSSDYDLLIVGGTVVTHEHVLEANIAVKGGEISAIAKNLDGSSAEIIDATGLHIFPGLIDSHVHFNEPGRTEWEGFETGSRALAAGGGTTFFEMPLNASPPTVDAESFDLKLAAASRSSLTDFALWGGLVPGNRKHMKPLADRGVIGFKAFMSNSGISDFERSDDRTLKDGMHEAAALGRLLAVHAEDEELTSKLSHDAISRNALSVRDYLASRPVQAELDAIAKAIDLAGETGCALHIVHVSSGAGVALVANAQQRGVDVTCETCPHYLCLTEDDMANLGAVAKCAPPLRNPAVQQQLWKHVLSGAVTTIGSDHSPSPPGMKGGSNFFHVWGGISGIQHTFPLMITEGHVNRSMALELIAKLTSFNVAQRFGITAPRVPSIGKTPAGTKGVIAPGADADLALIKIGTVGEVRASDLQDRHRQSPYVGRTLQARVVRTILRGQTIFSDGKPVAQKAGGRFVRPVTTPARP